MKIYKHNFIWAVILCTSVVFGQKQTKKISESFEVNKDVLVEINTRHSDVTVETWGKNVVTIKGVWEVEGMTKEEATEYFEGWDFEALGNRSKVVITSKSTNNYYFHSDVFDDMDFDFDFESIVYRGEMFNGDYFSELPPLPPMDVMLPMPPFPAPVIEHLSEVEFDYKAYQKDKDGYMKEFQKRQEKWEKEFEDKLEPQMKAYEEKMKQWEKEMEPQIKAYEEKMKQWEKEIEPQMKAYEEKMEAHSKKMEEKMKKMEKEMEEKYAKKMEVKGAEISKKFKIKKSIIIKIPKGAILKIDARYGEITLPNGIKTVD